MGACGVVDPAKLLVPRDKQAALTWTNVRVEASTKKGTKVLLDDVVGYAEAHHMVALMGPSGSGKSTLLDCLAGRSHKNLRVTGNIHVNGSPAKLSYGMVAYVPQDDLFTGTLTVRETLQFAARLRLQLPAADRANRVECVMSELGLTSAANTPVGTTLLKGISGGQKRRLSIAAEMIVQPALLFLDEPTSGLDAASAFFCVQALRKLATQGRAVVMSIHQPSAEAFDLFDQLLLLSKGRMVFFGQAAECGRFYEAAGHACPQNRALPDHFIFAMNTDFSRVAADFASAEAALLEAARSDPEAGVMSREAVKGGTGGGIGGTGPTYMPDAERGIQDLTHHFERTLRAATVSRTVEIDKGGWSPFQGLQNLVSSLSQFATLTARVLINSWRDIGVFWLRLGMYLMLCLALGTVYFDLGKSWTEATSRGGLLFFAMSFLTFMSVSGFPAFVDDVRVFVRERLNGYYGVLPYTVANTVATAPFIALMAIACSVVVYFLAGLNSDVDRVFYFMLNIFSALMVVEALMMAIAAVVPHYLLGLAVGAGLLGMMMPVAGFIIPTNDIPKPVWRYPVQYLAYHTYSLNGLMSNEFLGTAGWDCPCSIQPEGCGPAGCTLDGREVLAALNYNVSRSKWWDIGVLWLMVLVLRLAFFGMLKLREMRSK